MCYSNTWDLSLQAEYNEVAPANPDASSGLLDEDLRPGNRLKMGTKYYGLELKFKGRHSVIDRKSVV